MAAAGYRFRTETGSVYEIDNEDMSRKRASATLAGGVLRSDGGELVEPVIPLIGEPVVFAALSPFRKGAQRFVVTTMVVAVEERHDAV